MITTNLIDNHLIKIDSVYDERPTETGFIRLNAGFYREEKELDRYERKLLTGTIVQCPSAYSEAPMWPIDLGIPNPKIYMGHDVIQNRINLGYSDWGPEKYYPGLTEKIDFIITCDFARQLNTQVGDRVYFHPSVTEGENKVSEDIYKCAPHELIAVIRNGTVLMQGGYVLVEPIIEESTESAGLITKLESEANLMEGIVRHSNTEDLEAGARVVFLEFSDWLISFEGEQFYCMREDEIILIRK